MKVHEVAKRLDKLDKRRPRGGRRGPAGIFKQAGGDAPKFAQPCALAREERAQ